VILDWRVSKTPNDRLRLHQILPRPEIMLTWQKYDVEVDICSAGCIFAEMLEGKPLFRGRTTSINFLIHYRAARNTARWCDPDYLQWECQHSAFEPPPFSLIHAPDLCWLLGCRRWDLCNPCQRGSDSHWLTSSRMLIRPVCSSYRWDSLHQISF